MVRREKTAEEILREQIFAGKRILLVEDNEINMEIAEALLQLLGISVEKAWNGKEALRQYFKSPRGYYDLILLDINMPVMNGMETIRHIRKKEIKRTPVIAFTTETSPVDVEAYRQAGMDDWMEKPADLLLLCKVIQKWL